MRPIHLLIAVLFTGCSLLFPRPAAGEEGLLRVKGTEGAALRIDGKDAGSIPVGELRLAAGEHSVRLSKRGYLSSGTSVYLRSLRGETVVLYLRPKNANGAALRNLAFSGWGSMYNERKREAAGYLAAQALILGYALHENRRFEDRLNDYGDKLAEYESAVGVDDITAARIARDEAYDKVSSSESNRNRAIWAAVVVQALSAIDAWYRFPFTGEDSRIVLAPGETTGEKRGSSLAICFRF